MSGLKPFFSFYGSKYRTARKYPKPVGKTIIEPFAGSAGYSALYPTHNVRLYDKDPVVVGVWEYLIGTSPEEIRSLPDLDEDEKVNDLSVCQEAKWLIGFWVNKGSTRPSQTPSAWMRAGTHTTSFWGDAIRERLATQVDSIRHWKVFESDYKDIPNEDATWFIDPPYEVAGTHYKMGSKGIDYKHLAQWCRDRDGSAIVCENEGASWLPFEYFLDAKANESKSGGKVSKEMLWRNTL